MFDTTDILIVVGIVLSAAAVFYFRYRLIKRSRRSNKMKGNRKDKNSNWVPDEAIYLEIPPNDFGNDDHHTPD